MTSSPENTPVFGEKIAGKLYIQRPGAYAIILDAHQRIAILQTPQGYFLPGGGRDDNEGSKTTLQREVMEECGYRIEVGQQIGEAVEYIYAKSEDQYYQIHSTFFEAVLGKRITEGREGRHTLIWLDASTAVGRLQRQSQAWAVQQAISKSDISRGMRTVL